MIMLDVPLSYGNWNGIAIDGRSTYIMDPVWSILDGYFANVVSLNLPFKGMAYATICHPFMAIFVLVYCLFLGLPLKKMKETLAELDHWHVRIIA